MKKYIFCTLLALIFAGLTAHAQIITTIAGGGLFFITDSSTADSNCAYNGDGGPATAAMLSEVEGVAVDAKGNLFVSTSCKGCGSTITCTFAVVKKVSAGGIISTFAGTDTVGFSGDGGPATSARLYDPSGIACDKKGNVYIVDEINYRVRKVDTNGIITTFAGSGCSDSSTSGDGGPATAACLGSCIGICIDTIGNVYIAANDKVRKVDTNGIITTFAGTGDGAWSGDGGPATAAGIDVLTQIALDEYGNMYIYDAANNRIRKINKAGIITTIAGTGAQGYSGDGGPATLAKLYGPTGVFVDNCNNVYIADNYNDRVRVVDGDGIITTFAGNGHGAYAGDGGLAAAAELHFPNCVCLDKNGNVYISDFENYRVRYVAMDGCVNTTGVASPQALPHGEGALRVYPNPAAGGVFSLNVSAATNEDVQVVVSNMMGEVVNEFTTTTNKETQVRLNVAAGVYFVSAATGEGRYNAKVVLGR